MNEEEMHEKPCGFQTQEEVIFDSGINEMGRCNKRLKLELPAKEISLDDLRRNSNYFHPENLIAVGNAGILFFAEVDDGRNVVFRVLKDKFVNPLSHDEFGKQVKTIESLNHENIVELYGCFAGTVEDRETRMLVYEYATNMSLFDNLHGIKKDAVVLDWKQRINIAIDVATGLEYLHSMSIAYQDLKANNVLLFEDYRAKLGDINVTYRDVNLQNVEHYCRGRSCAAEIAYYDPHYMSYQDYTKESDVYSFGVLLLVLLTGIKAYETETEISRQFIISRIGSCIGKQKILGILDARLSGSCSKNAVAKVGALAAYCLLPPPSLRPDMGFVIRALKVIRDEPNEHEIEKRIQDVKVELGEENPLDGSVTKAVQRVLNEKDDYELYYKIWKLSEELGNLGLDRAREKLYAETWFLQY